MVNLSHGVNGPSTKIPLRGSSMVEHLAVNEAVVGSNPTRGAEHWCGAIWCGVYAAAPC